MAGMTGDRDGRHDFDTQFGHWNTRVSVLRHPLTGTGEWVDYEGTTAVTPIWDGVVNLVQLDACGPGGELHALILRLYDEGSAHWTLNFVSRGSGEVRPPTVGRFDGAGRGEFRSQEERDGRTVEVLVVMTTTGKDQWRFEQSFSADGGATWETNWIAIDTRVVPA
jgi:hypothetical protein